MGYLTFIWDLENDPEGNRSHIAEHGVIIEEVEEVLSSPWRMRTSKSSGRPIAFGETSEGRWLAVVFIEIDDETVYPITAFEPDR